MPTMISNPNHEMGTYHRGLTHVDEKIYCQPYDYSEKSLIEGGNGHYGWPHYPPYKNIGGSFSLLDRGIQIGGTYAEIVGSGPYASDYYKGLVWTSLSLANVSMLPALKMPDTWGPEAYRKMKPDKPIMQVLNSIYELRELPAQLEQRFLQTGLAGIGSYYLALKFGWEPLLKDLTDVILFQMKAQKALKQLLRDEGRPVQRWINLVDMKSAETVTSGTGYVQGPNLVTYFHQNVPTYTDTLWSTDRVWASARFRYWLPPGPRDIKWKNEIYHLLAGRKVTPSVIYKAIPWSWLTDWMFNLGNVISNLETSVVDRLAADYFYVMREYKDYLRRDSKGKYFNLNHPVDNNTVPIEISSSSLAWRSSKVRKRGDPFGLATNQNMLSGTQWAILGALGLSKLG